MKFNQKRIIQHILFWGGIVMFYIFSSASPEQFYQLTETTLLKLPLLMIAAYLLNYWQIPRLLNKKRYIFFALSMLVIIIIMTVFFRVMGFCYLDKYCAEGPYPLLSWGDFSFYMLSFHFPAVIMYFFKTTKSQEIEKARINLLEKEKAETELKYLKAQLNPHFLFNTLNNLYSFVLDQSPKAPEMVLQLSGILDFILYKSRQAYVSLGEEIQIMENYIALEQIKYDDRLSLTFIKNISDATQKVSPLVLLSIVENAFKHGVRGSIARPSIKIEVVQHEFAIEFTVWNTKVVSPKVQKSNNINEGIGLVNIRRQLDLIYPNQHQLMAEDTIHYFNLKLILNLNSND